MFDLTSMQDATENCHYPELIEEPLRLELNITFPPEHVTEFIVLWERMFLVAVDKFSALGRNIQNGQYFSQANNELYSATQILIPRFIFSDYEPILDIDNIAIVNTQPSKMQGEYWINFANFCQEMFFADSLGR